MRALGPDGRTAANVTAENMLTLVDFEGSTTTMMEGIIDHDRDENTVFHMKDKYVRTYSNQRRLRKSTAGWKLQILWKDKPESWVHLKDIKESHPIEVAKYATVCGIDDEPAFAWW
eukprot:885126-Ditylum_brightwellii.AAC.1